MVFELQPVDLENESTIDMIFIWITLGANVLFFIPTLLYSIISFYRHRSHASIRARHPRTIVTITIGSLLYIIIKSLKFVLGSSMFYARSLHYLYFITSPFPAQMIIYASLLRFWLLFFDINHSKAVANVGWKKYIDPSVETSSWLLKHKHNFGNEWWCAKILSIFFIIASCIVAAGRIYLGILGNYVNLTVCSIPLLMIAIIWLKTPKYYDFFRIREEARAFVIIVTILMASYALLITIGVIGGFRIFYLHLIGEWTFLIGIWTMIIYHSWWALKKSKIHESMKLGRDSKSNIYTKTKKIYKTHSNKQQSKHSMDIRHVPRTASGAILQSSYYNLIKILQNIEAFKLFMNHLTKEFSIENGLAIIEFTQYQQLIQQRYDDKQDILIASSNHKKNNQSRSSLPSMKKKNSSAKLAQFVSGTVAKFRDNTSTKKLQTIEKNLHLNVDNIARATQTHSSMQTMEIIDIQTPSPDYDDDEEEEDMDGIQIVMNDKTSITTTTKLNDNDHYEVWLDLPSSLPKSSIIWNDENEELSIKINELVNKYIAPNSNFELNISSRERKRILSLVEGIDNLNETVLYHIFDPSIKSLLHLLNDSLTRFTETASYKHVEKNISSQRLSIGKIQRTMSF